jgi:hypothetical protein
MLVEKLLFDETVNRVSDEFGNIYGIRVLGRGENLFFQENDNGLICQIDAVNSIIFTNSVKEWEGKKRMSKEEKQRVIGLIKKYYSEIYDSNVRLHPEETK